MKRSALILLAVLAFGTMRVPQAEAQHELEIANYGVNGSVSIDLDTIEPWKSYKSVWAFRSQLRRYNGQTPIYDTSHARLAIDCQNQRVATLEYVNPEPHAKPLFIEV